MSIRDSAFFHSLNFKLLVWLCGAVTVISTAFGAYTYLSSQHELRQGQARVMQAVVERLQKSLPQALWNFDKPQVLAALQAEGANADLLSVDVYDAERRWQMGAVRNAQGAVVAASAAAQADGRATQDAELRYADGPQEKKIGVLRLRFDDASIRAAQADILQRALVQTLLLAVSVVVVGGWIVRRMLLRPLGQLQAAVRELSAGEADLTRRLSTPGQDEFATLARDFNRFIEGLHDLVANIRQSAGEASTAAREIAAGNLDLSTRTEHQASATQQTVATSSRIASSVQQNAATAREVSQTAATTRVKAEEGQQIVGAVVASMQEMHASSKRIEEIIGVINGIAFQTNILALNAAVEAARAGEHGRGFAVVAGEVRSLASRVATASMEVKTLIETAVDSVKKGDGYVRQASVAIDQVATGVAGMNELMNEIAQASDQQMHDIGSINHEMHQIDASIQQNSALVEQSAAASAALSLQAEKLLEQVSRFKVSA